MFILALTIGLYSYSIFFLGIFHLLTRTNILVVSLIFLSSFSYFFLSIISFRLPKLDKLSKIFLILIILQLLVNLIGALGPEIGFDALWYHLTLPKIWLQRHAMIFIPGSQFKYSVMPMLTEMFYFIFPGKLVHYLFGILTLTAAFKLSRKFLSINYSLLAVLILVSNLVFSWEQTSAYIDLARAFFEILALYLFLDNKIYKSAIVLGLAASTKLLAFGSLPIFWILIQLKTKSLKYIIRYSLFVILVVSPWLLRAYLAAGNPVYPFFTSLYSDIHAPLDPRDLLTLLTNSPDPINPIYLIILSILPFLKINNIKFKTVCLYSLLSLIVWTLTPNTGGGRFILPYLPALSIVTAAVISKHKLLTLFVIPYSLFVISYRFAANLKYLQPKEQILAKHLNFNFGDYYDFDHFFKINDRVLSIGVNNLYYLNANIVFNNPDYILLRDSQLIDEYKNWKLVLRNAITKTLVYERPD